MKLRHGLRFEGPDLTSRWYWLFGGRGGDEYGNPSLYFRCVLFGVIWDYPTGHYQTDVELPDPGESAWIDRVFYPGFEDE